MKLYPKEELYIVIIIMTSLAHLSVGQSDCSPAFTLPNILKGTACLFRPSIAAVQQRHIANKLILILFRHVQWAASYRLQYCYLYSGISQLAIQLSSSSLNFYLDV